MYYDQKYYSNYVEKHRNRLKMLYERISQQTQNKKQTVIDRRNDNLQNVNLIVGQEVYIKVDAPKRKGKLCKLYEGPFKIFKINDNNTVIVVNDKNKQRNCHVKNLKLGSLTGSLPADI